LRIWIATQYLASRDIHLRCVVVQVMDIDVIGFTANQAVTVTFFDHIVINYDEITDANMAELLSKMRSPAAVSDKPHL